jgi:hypothetical protein
MNDIAAEFMNDIAAVAVQAPLEFGERLWKPRGVR